MAVHYTTNEEHPLPARLMHWAHLIAMAVLIFTGFYIHGPFFPASMTLIRELHFIFMFVLIFVLVIRIWWAFFGAGSARAGSRQRVRDYKHFGPEPQYKGAFIGTIKYYLFLQKEHAASGKYNPLQKGTYVFWAFLIILQAITGFALWGPTATFFLPLTYAMGGVMAMRSWHYLFMWLFIVTSAIHIYLSALYPTELSIMFLGKETGPGPDGDAAETPAVTPGSRAGGKTEPAPTS